MYLSLRKQLWLKSTPLNKRLITLSQITIPEVPQDRWLSGIAVSVVFIVITWTVMILRLFTRYFLVSLGKDDLAMAITLVLFTVYCAGVISLELLARDKTILSASLMTKMINILITTEVFYIWTMISLKISLALFYSRILREKWQRTTANGIAILCATFGFAYFWYTVFQCGVPGQGETFWIKTITHECVNRASILGFGYTHAIISAGTDIALSIMPIPMIRKSNMPSKEKIIISVILLLAAAGSIASCIRVRYIKILAYATLNLWNEVQGLAVWSAIEPGLGITAASLATLRPLLQKSIRTLRSFSSNRRFQTTGSSNIKGSKPTANETGVTTLTANSTNLEKGGMPSNFLLSATNPMSPLATFDEKKQQRSSKTHSVFPPPLSLPIQDHQKQTDEGRATSPDLDPATDPIPLPAIFRPLPTDERNGRANNRNSWWDLSSLSNRATRRFSGTETHNSRDVVQLRDNTRCLDASAEPTISEPIQLEAGYRRWVIDRSGFRSG